jgi:hypothetical protein
MSFSFYDADMLNRLKDQNNGTSGLVSKLCQNKFCICVDIAYFVHNQINYLSVGLLLLFVTFEKELKSFFCVIALQNGKKNHSSCSWCFVIVGNLKVLFVCFKFCQSALDAVI